MIVELTLYTDRMGIELNKDGESFVATTENFGQGFKFTVNEESVERHEDSLVTIVSGAALVDIEKTEKDEDLEWQLLPEEDE